MTDTPSRFAMLKDLAAETSSEGRRELLRKVTETLGSATANEEMGQFDELLAAVASDYSATVRADLARLVAQNDAQFTCSAQLFAMDEIAIATPILRKSKVLSEATLLKVISAKSQEHLMVVSQREALSEGLSQALVENGNDDVVVSLLTNPTAQIAAETFEAVAVRAQDSTQLQAPLVGRHDIPVAILNDLYLTVETSLRQEILRKIGNVSPEEMERSFKRSRKSLTSRYAGVPPDMDAAAKRVDLLARQGMLKPPLLVTLLREGKPARTAFMLAFARLVDMEYDMIQRVVEGGDLDSLALFCRGANFERALFVALAIGLDGKDRGMAGAEEYAKQYESVPVVAAQRAIRFWKVRAAA